MWRFWIDTGGTFTDCLAEDPHGRQHRAKVLSSSCVRGTVVSSEPGNRLRVRLRESVADGFFEGYLLRVVGVEWAMAMVKGWDAAPGEAILDRALPELPTGCVCEFQSPEEPPTFVARLVTQTRLSDPLPAMEMRLATTRGTNALLERKGAKVAFFATKGFGDLLRIGNQQRPKLFELGIQKPEPLASLVFEIEERLDKDGNVLVELNEMEARTAASAAVAAGVVAVAVAFLHSYRNPGHERRVEAILKESGIDFVSLSSDLSPFVKILPRAETAVVDAYLGPLMSRYLDAVQASLSGGRATPGAGSSQLRIMTSAGGLVGRERYRAKDSLLSGPAGGVVGSSSVGTAAGRERTIAFDMGGTSTDVSRFDGRLDYRFEQRIGSARVFAPTLRIETVAAGGGSICWFDGSALRVGPESAGANPGPACYGAGGPLAITDVNLLLGRVDARQFGIPIDPVASRRRLSELQTGVREQTGEAVSEFALLSGFIDIANERMAEAIRKVSLGEGYAPSDYDLVAFGGAGGMHACAIAERLGIARILFPADSGLLSAYGLRVARMEQFAGRQVLRPLGDCWKEVPAWAEELGAEALALLAEDGVTPERAEIEEARCELRFLGQESTLTLNAGRVASLDERFRAAYEDQFGFAPQGQAVELVSIRVAARERAAPMRRETFDAQGDAAPVSGFVERASLRDGTRVVGPAIVQDAFSTVFVDTGWAAVVGSLGTLQIARVVQQTARRVERSEVVELELFTNRYLAIVEEMGALLERAAFSTNVKERKDFSCTLLDAEGYLVANAPHIPVHLGALGVCARTVLKELSLEAGDVVVTNHPAYGGSHLPDVTLIVPVFSEDGAELLGYVANRAHHAELGGIAPGSMPPGTRSLEEEGIVIPPIKLMAGGESRWAELEERLLAGRYPTRAIAENRADLAAQLASARQGAKALRDLAQREGVARTRHYMKALRERAATALRRALENLEGDRFAAEESLDSGASVKVEVTRSSAGRWRIDFAGTAPQQASNYNATPAIATSAVMYALRLLAAEDIPLNEGVLDVIEIALPEGMLNPRFVSDPAQCPPVVAGNVEVSQLVVATLLKALGLAACSQATMNNLIFGTESFGYYETIAGGEGATPLRAGASGAHTHMTNTAMTDPEIFELRYPVRLEAFALRVGSGGAGRQCGGEGVVKRIRFLEPVILSLLTQRRVIAPFGMAGGEAGALGMQRLIYPEGVAEILPGNGQWQVAAGTVLEIATPGGGGWGKPGD